MLAPVIARNLGHAAIICRGTPSGKWGCASSDGRCGDCQEYQPFQNITLSLPEVGIREARILAASRGTSVSQLLARMLRELVEKETGYAPARDRSLAQLREGMDLGTGGHISWSRDSVHER